jgi:hypothetical protein
VTKSPQLMRGPLGRAAQPELVGGAVRLLANYWWLIVFPVAAFLFVRSWLRVPRLVTGDIHSPYLSLRLTGGWRGVILVISVGVLALLVAQRLASKRVPPA